MPRKPTQKLGTLKERTEKRQIKKAKEYLFSPKYLFERSGYPQYKEEKEREEAKWPEEKLRREEHNRLNPNSPMFIPPQYDLPLTETERKHMFINDKIFYPEMNKNYERIHAKYAKKAQNMPKYTIDELKQKYSLEPSFKYSVPPNQQKQARKFLQNITGDEEKVIAFQDLMNSSAKITGEVMQELGKNEGLLSSLTPAETTQVVNYLEKQQPVLRFARRGGDYPQKDMKKAARELGLLKKEERTGLQSSPSLIWNYIGEMDRNLQQRLPGYVPISEEDKYQNFLDIKEARQKKENRKHYYRNQMPLMEPRPTVWPDKTFTAYWADYRPGAILTRGVREREADKIRAKNLSFFSM